MLVVLAIIGVASAAVALSLAPRGGIAVEAEAQRLAGAIQAAADAAMVAGPAAALLAEPRAYTVAHAVDGRWQGARHVLADGVRLDGTTAAPVPIGLGATIDLTLTRGGDAWRVAFDGLRASARRAGAS